MAVLRGRVAARLAALAGWGKLASLDARGHKSAMRHIAILIILLVAACAPRPETASTPAVPQAPATSEQAEHRSINGMTAHELIQLFGRPRLQVVEGEGTKLQFAGPNCLLDVYLYPSSGGGTPRATLIEARNSQGDSVNAQNCAASIQNR